jgi:hypothetical protein
MRIANMLALSLTVVAACASGGAGRGAGHPGADSTATAPRPRPRRGGSDLITLEEIRAAQWTNAYDMIEALHPRWLHVHGPDSILGETADVQVRVDNMRLGGPETLRSISLIRVSRIEFVDPITAASRWGGSHANGAIVITTLGR